jgi:hypothetical protein
VCSAIIRAVTFFIGSVEGALLASVFFMILITALQTFVWFKNRQRAAVGLALLVVTVGLYAALWWWLWSGFYKLTVTDRAVELTKYFPTRVTAVDKASITNARWVPGYKNTWVLVIDTTAGQFESARAGVPAEQRAAISAALGRE